jgi:transcriptional regulator with XRE-family HTH domain
MKAINIGKVLINKRKEHGLTQDDLARFIGVSKASVSKWETGTSYPDVVFLPQLAAYFGISLDQLMGYEPQMNAEDLRSLYAELVREFATKPYQEVRLHCLTIARKYYSCFPLLYQIALLLLNYSPTADDPTLTTNEETIREAKTLLERVKLLSDNIELKQLALQAEAMCEMMLDRPDHVIALLAKESRVFMQPSIGTLLSLSYEKKGALSEAKIALQESLFDSVVILFFDLISYLSIFTADADTFEETYRRAVALDDIFHFQTLFPMAILSFYMTAAEGYMTLGKTDRSLLMLEHYVEAATGDLFPLTPKADHFFTLLDRVTEKQLKSSPLIMPKIPLDNHSIKQSIVQGINNPLFTPLSSLPRYQKLVQKLSTLTT